MELICRFVIGAEDPDVWLALYFLILGICSYQDLRSHRISMVWIALLAGVSASMAWQREGWGWVLITDLLPGIFLLGISYLTRGQVGTGDGFIVAFSGWGFGWELAVVGSWLALMAVSLVGITGVLLGKRKKEHRYPLIPFLFLAQGICVWLGAIR